MSLTKGVKVDFVDPCAADTAHETPGIDAADFFADDYWERRCHRAEENLRAIARELERVQGSLEEKLAVITLLEQDNRMLLAQLDMVHLIFGYM